jgi:Xaa-Pro aminopeptidase
MSRLQHPISDQELARRWAATRAAMAAEGFDALVMQNSNDWLGGSVKWFTDIPALNGYPRSVIFHRDDLMSVIDNGPLGIVRKLDGSDLVHRGVGEILYTPAFLSIGYTNCYDGELAGEVLKPRGYKKIGLVHEGAMPQGFVAALRAALGDVFADATDLVDGLKAIKSAEEIQQIRATAHLQDLLYARVLDVIRPGMRDIDVIAAVEAEGHRLGSEQGIYLGGSAPLGTRSSFLSRHLQGRTIEQGDNFSLLIEVNGPGGFYTEIARTMVFGKASQELRDGFAAVKEAQDFTLSLMRPGADPAAIAAAHDEFMQARGLPAELRVYSHGQGYDMVERPLIRRDETMKLAAGMCLAVHPGYENERQFSVICDDYLITETGVSECLHWTPKQIFEL